MDLTQQEQIYRPYLTISYKEMKSDIINDRTSTPAKYLFEYFSDYSKIKNDTLIAFIFMNIMAFLATVVRIYYFSKRNPRAAMEDNAMKIYFLKVLLNLMDTWSEYMFYLLFFFTSSIFIAYKMQMNAYLLLPELGPTTEGFYSGFHIVMILTLIFKLLTVVGKIIEQSSIDIFIIDFENPNIETKQINGWRYLFVANEFNELQTRQRYVVPETLFIWFAFFWVGLGWQYVSFTTPDYVYEDSLTTVNNVILKFFMASVLFFGIGIVQFILHNIDNYLYGSEINSFKDLCTLANISMVILDEVCHGYYLHGKAPW